MSKRKSFPLRVDERIYDAVRRWSDAELRSVNAQIEYVLRESLRRAGRWPDTDAGETPSERKDSAT